MIVPKYFEDLHVLHKNTMPNRAYYIPASVPMELQPETREASDRFLLLSGDWKFRYYENIYDVKDAFFEDGYDTSAFDEVKVLESGRIMAMIRHQYTNIPLSVSDGSALCSGGESLWCLCAVFLLCERSQSS